LLSLAALALLTLPIAAHLDAAMQGGGGQSVINAPDHPMLRGFRWRAIGPVAQGARIDDIAVDESNPSTYYIGYAVSGLWKTTDNGTTFEPILDELAHSIGDIALAPSDSNILYVGTGEPNNRQSSSVGVGMFKSTDAGESFQRIGLEDTQSIARVVVHPRDPNTVWVAAAGHLFGPNEERGVFKSTNGGTTWERVLHVNQDTGAIDLVIDPSSPDTVIAATYERRRAGWGFVGGGPGSGIHRSTNGGRTWTRLSGNGLPRGTMGRVGLDWSRSNPDVVYAQIEVAPDKEPRAQDAPEPQAGRGGRGGGRGGGQPAPPDPTRSGVWRSNDKGRSWTFVSNENNRPMYYSQIRVDPNNENVVYVGGQNAAKSVDGGKTFENIQGGMGHVDNHAIWIDPNDSDHVMYGNDGGLDVSYDGGEDWESVRTMPVALPYHVSVGMDRPYTVCTGLQDNGSWCGPSTVRSQAIRAWHWVSVGGGDGFQTQIDPTNPNVFYSESQNGNIRKYDVMAGTSGSIRPGTGGRGNIVQAPDDTPLNFNWNSPIRISPHNPSTLLFGGNRLFISTNQGETWRMTDELGKGIDVTQRTLLEHDYSLPNCGRGAGPGEACIPSRGDGIQAQEFKTIIEIAESPVVPGIYWVGTADGNVQVSRDGGRSWTEVSRNLPGGSREYWASGVEASHVDPAAAYVSLDGHHSDDFTPYVFKTTDYGASWTSIAGNLPRGNVRSIRQDPVNRQLLYATTEFGFYVSLNDGQSWSAFMPDLPVGRVDEVVVHPRDHDLVLASHGRGIFIMDDITALQQLAGSTPAEPTLLAPRDAVMWKNDVRLGARLPGTKGWAGENAPRGTAIAYYLPGAPAGEVLVTITNTATGEAVRTCVGPAETGLNRFQWTLTGDPTPDAGGGGRGGRGGGRGGQGAAPAPAPAGPTPCVASGGGQGRGGRGGGGGGGGGITPGTYQVKLTIGGREVGASSFRVLEDVWMK
jgi:photosystem II stability/assembly factor-like uncharacterized protein